MDLVSIVIPYYKKKEYVKKSINSVLNQTYKKFEIIIIYDDEELTDLDYLKNIVKSDKRINLIINKKSLVLAYQEIKASNYRKVNILLF